MQTPWLLEGGSLAWAQLTTLLVEATTSCSSRRRNWRPGSYWLGRKLLVAQKTNSGRHGTLQASPPSTTRRPTWRGSTGTLSTSTPRSQQKQARRSFLRNAFVKLFFVGSISPAWIFETGYFPNPHGRVPLCSFQTGGKKYSKPRFSYFTISDVMLSVP